MELIGSPQNKGMKLTKLVAPRDLRGSVVERPITLEDVRAEVLTPQRLNAFVFSAAGLGIAAGAAGGHVLARVPTGFFGNVQLPWALPVIDAAVVLIGAAIVGSLVPATRASR